MDKHIKADSNQDTSLWTFHVTFVNGEVEENFLNVSGSRECKKGQLEITVVNSDGCFEGSIRP